MATLVDLSGFQRGVEADETSMNIESFDVTYTPEFKDFVLDKSGEKRGFAIGAVESKVSFKGEVTATSSGVIAITFGTAFVPGNDVDGFGQTAGGCYADSVTISQSRAGFRSISIEMSRNAGIA